MAEFLDRMYQISKIANLIEESSNGFSIELKQKDTASPCLYINWAYAIRPYIKIIDRRDACPTVLFVIQDCFVTSFFAMTEKCIRNNEEVIRFHRRIFESPCC